MSRLPLGWSKHQSSKFPGHEYFFNQNTGATVWRLDQVMGCQEVELQSGPASRDQADPKQAKPPAKRKKIVFDLDSPIKPNVISQISAASEKSSVDRSIGIAAAPDIVNELEHEPVEDSFMVMDEDELHCWKNMESKFQSPEKEIPSPDLPSFEEVEDTAPRTSPPETDIPAPVDLLECQRLRTQIGPDDYVMKYRNFEEEERPKYQRELSERKCNFSARHSPIESEFRRNQVWEYPQPDLDRTPEYDYDTPEEFSDLDEGVHQEFYPETEVSPQGNASLDSSFVNEEQGGTDEETTEEDEGGQEYEEDVYVGFEADPPSSTSLERELEEEERCLEDVVDASEIRKEVSFVRNLVSETEDTEIEEESRDEGQPLVCSGQVVVVLDTDVLLSSLSDLIELLGCRSELTMVVPWQVRQELDTLVLSENKVVEVRARAAVRWLTNVLLTRSNVQAQTASQARSTSHGQTEPEDSILATCTALLGQGRTVLFATEDRSLAVKMTNCGVRSGDSGAISAILTGRETDNRSFAEEEEEVVELLEPVVSDDLATRKVEDLLTKTWQMILDYTIGFAETFHVSHELDQSQLDQRIEFGSLSDAVDQLPGFLSKVSDIHQSMEQLIDSPENDGKCQVVVVSK